MSTPAEVAQRRATVRRLAQSGASARSIAAQLGIGKDTVRRDLAHTLAHPKPPTETPAQRIAHRVAQTETAMAQLCAAAQAVDAAEPAYNLAADATAAHWCATLRATAAQLLAHADAFTDYYRGATIGADIEPTGAPRATTCATGAQET